MQLQKTWPAFQFLEYASPRRRRRSNRPRRRPRTVLQLVPRKKGLPRRSLPPRSVAPQEFPDEAGEASGAAANCSGGVRHAGTAEDLPVWKLLRISVMCWCKRTSRTRGSSAGTVSRRDWRTSAMTTPRRDAARAGRVEWHEPRRPPVRQARGGFDDTWRALSEGVVKHRCHRRWNRRSGRAAAASRKRCELAAISRASAPLLVGLVHGPLHRRHPVGDHTHVVRDRLKSR